MNDQVNKCPICDLPAILRVGYDGNFDVSIYSGHCARCGQVHVTQTVVNDLRETEKLYLLSAFFRRHVGKPPLIKSQNVDELLAGMPLLRTVSEKMDGLLKVLVSSKFPPGSPATFAPRGDYPLIFAANWQEADFLLGQLSVRKLVTPITGTPTVQVNADGYERIEQLEAASYKSTRNAFVAMSFDKARDFVYNEAIEPAIREAGYRAIRIDKTEYVNRIDDEIIAQLRQSRFAVADFTGQRGGVYYEAGFMHGMGRNVFLMVEKCELEKVHFDVRQYNFVDYDSPSDAKERLYNRIMAVEGRGPGTGDKQD